MMWRNRSLMMLTVLFLLGPCEAPAQHDLTIAFHWPPRSTVWKAELGASGGWFDQQLWTDGVPDAETQAFLLNGSETLLTEGEAKAAWLQLGWAHFGRSRLTQTGGSLAVGGSVTIEDGVYRQLGGRLMSDSMNIGLSFLVFQLPDISDVPQPEPSCAATDDCAPDFDRFGRESRFQLDGGDVDIIGQIRVNPGALNIVGGSMRAGSLYIDGSVWNSQKAKVHQHGGIVNFDSDLAIQDGAYALAGGTLTTDRLVMGDPNMTQVFSVGTLIPRRPEFFQTGGELHVLDNLELCVPGFVWPQPSVPAFTDVTYRLEAGNLQVDGNTVVGSLGVAPAHFLQSGGSHHTAGTLRVEGETSRYELSGGELRVGNLDVSTNVFNEGGALALAPGGQLIVDSRLALGTQAVVEARSESSIQVNGGVVEIMGNQAELLAGLADITLAYSGVDDWSTLEAASADFGDDSQGFEENFAWDSLLVGTEGEGALLRLEDDYVNGSAADAVYVNRLVVAADSTLDLNGINLYYHEAEISGNVLSSGGSLISVPVPEPATLVLLAVVSVIGLSTGRYGAMGEDRRRLDQGGAYALHFHARA